MFVACLVCFSSCAQTPKVILKDVDSLLYVDTDVLFLRPIDDIWHLLREFNSTQLAAMAPEHEMPKIGWYSRFARHPYYGSTGLNSGVMLMNLTRIRSTHFKVREVQLLHKLRLGVLL